jgi:hypothetical protein
MTFLPNPNSLPQVNHKNSNKLDNTLKNLEWCTAKDNVKHYRNTLPGKQLTLKFSFANGNNKAVIQMTLDGVFVKKYKSTTEAVKDGYNGSCISKCCNGLSRKHKKYKWCFEKDHQEKIFRN